MTASTSGELNKPTHRSQRRFSQRTTGLPWNLTFADATKNLSDCDSSRSRMPNDDRDNFGAERLHPMVTMQRCRPDAVHRRVDVKDCAPPLAAYRVVGAQVLSNFPGDTPVARRKAVLNVLAEPKPTRSATCWMDSD